MNPNLEKVEKGLRFCFETANCDGCPYEMECRKISFKTPENHCPILDDVLSLLKKQEAEAKWIYGEDKTGVDGWYCSECNFFEPWFYEFTEDIDFIRFYRHCPRCGREMTSYTGKPTQERR